MTSSSTLSTIRLPRTTAAVPDRSHAAGERIAALEAQKVEIDAAIATLHAACARLSARGEATQAA